MRIASLTKPFASTLLMPLVEQGKLDLDELMVKYSPEFRQRFGGRSITMRHVFTHTSHHPSGDSCSPGTSSTPSAWPTRSTRDATRSDWPDSPDRTGSTVRRRSEASIHRVGISAAAGLVSNVLDLANYDQAIDGHTLVRAETQERAWTPASTPEGKELPYGLGWFVQSHEGTRLVWHYGYWPESFSSLYVAGSRNADGRPRSSNEGGLSRSNAGAPGRRPLARAASRGRIT